MSHGSDSHVEFLGAPRCTPYYPAPVNLRALRKLSSIAPSTSRFSFSVSLKVGSEEDVFSFHVLEVFGHLLGGRGQVDMVMDDAGWVAFLRAAGEGMHGGPFLRIAAEFEDDFAAEYACGASDNCGGRCGREASRV